MNLVCFEVRYIAWVTEFFFLAFITLPFSVKEILTKQRGRLIRNMFKLTQNIFSCTDLNLLGICLTVQI